MAYQYIASATKQFPFVKSGSVNSLPQGSFPAGAYSLITPKTAGSNNTEQYPHRSYVMQWNLNVQRELASKLTLMVGYVGSRGVHEPFRVDDGDIVLPTMSPAGWLFPKVDVFGSAWGPGCDVTDPNGAETGTCNPPPKINEDFGSIGRLHYEGNSYYHASNWQFKKR